MKNNQAFCFIDRNFSATEARELLMNLFSSKIQFHQMKNFSSLERFTKEDKLTEKNTDSKGKYGKIIRNFKKGVRTKRKIDNKSNGGN